MKKSYIRLYFLETIIFILLLINSFAFNYLSGYGMFFFLGVILIVFKMLFGFERERFPFIKDVIFEIVVLILSFFIIFYLVSIPIGFARTPEYLNSYGIRTFILPLVLGIGLQEFFRYEILKKSEGCKGLIITTVVLFTFLTITNALESSFSNFNSFFLFFSLTLLPAITENILCSYLCINIGYTPSILYRLIISLYIYILPIVPNPNEYIKALIDFLFPIIMILKIRRYLEEYKDRHVERDYNKLRLGFLFPGTLVLILVYFVSGYFRYYAIAIATDSMNPSIRAGDVVIIDQDLDKDDLKVGSVIAYKHNGTIIVHRIHDIMDYKDEILIYTKGDANEAMDSWVVDKDSIIGEVSLKVNWLGLPTVWINRLFER